MRAHLYLVLLASCLDGQEPECGPPPERPLYTSITFADGQVIQPEAQFHAHNEWANAMQLWARCVER